MPSRVHTPTTVTFSFSQDTFALVGLDGKKAVLDGEHLLTFSRGVGEDATFKLNIKA